MERKPLPWILLLALLVLPPLAAATSPGGPTVFSVNLTTRGPLPDPAIVGYEEHLPLEVRVTGPAGLVPPTEVHLSGNDSRGAPLRFDPNPVPLEPGRHRYPVTGRYAAEATGPADLEARARGPARAEDTWRAGLPVARDEVRVGIPSVAPAASDWHVPVDVAANTTRLPGDPANLTLRVRSAEDDPAVAWNASRKQVDLADEPGTWTLGFDARYGAGRYAVEAHARGPRSAGTSPTVLVDVDEPDQAGDEAAVRAVVPDRPATLTLTDDSVNDDGKPKWPGQEVVTRLVARDPNGLGHADGVAFTVYRTDPGDAPTLVRNRTAPLPDDAWTRREVPLEDRFGWAPLRDGTYLLRARLLGTEADPAERTFRIRDELPDLAGGGVPDALAATPVPALEGTARVADDNLGGGPDGPPVAALGNLSARLYRYTQELPPPAGVVFPDGQRTLDLTGTTSRPDNYDYGVDGDAGRFTIPFDVELPDDPDPGTYHVTIEHADAGEVRDLGALYFELAPPPEVTALEPGPLPPGANVTVDGSLAGAENASHVALRLEEPGDDEPLARAEAPGFPAQVPVPEGLPPGAELRLRATPVLPDGRHGQALETTIAVEPTPPALRVAVAADGAPAPEAPLRLLPRSVDAVNLTVHAASAHGATPDVTARLVDWEGDVQREGPCEAPPSPGGGHRCPVPLDEALPAGRYTLQVRASDPGGLATWNRTLETAPWLEVGIGDPLSLEPAGDGTLAGGVPLANTGNVPAPQVRLRVTALQGPDGATWSPDALEARVAGARASPTPGGPAVTLDRAAGPLLEPGEDARVELRVPLQPGVPPGTYQGTVTVTTPLEGGP